jgi:hypothetical protein
VTIGFTPAGEYTYRYGHDRHQSYLLTIEFGHPVPQGCFRPYTFPNFTIFKVADEIPEGIVAFHVFAATAVHGVPVPLVQGRIGAAAVSNGAAPVPYASN